MATAKKKAAKRSAGRPRGGGKVVGGGSGKRDRAAAGKTQGGGKRRNGVEKAREKGVVPERGMKVQKSAGKASGAKKSVAEPKAKAKTKSTAARAGKASSARPVREKLTAIRPSGQREDNFFELVHEVARQIPRGRVTSYGAIAAALGTRLSARMVGWAMNACHLSPKPVPAHRVVNSLGLLTGRHHFNPPEKMQELLEKEGTTVVDNKVVDFKTKFWNPSEEL